MCFIIFYLIFVQATLYGALEKSCRIDNNIPLEIPKKISSFFVINPKNKLFLSKSTVSDASNNFEILHFPSNSPFRFAVLNRDFVDKAALFDFQEGDEVAPHIQCWLGLQNKVLRIDNDVERSQVAYNYQKANKNSIVLFDESKQNKGVVVAMNSPFCTINLIVLENYGKVEAEYDLNSHIQSVDSGQKYNLPLSLCSHNGPSDWLCSLVVKQAIYGCEQTENDVQKIIFFSDSLISYHVKINAKTEIPLIKKHEWIGRNTFLVSTLEQLFFGFYNNDALSLYEQKFYTSRAVENQLKKYKQVSVVSFSANQDSDKKTEGGRARFFVVLVNNKTEDDQVEQIIFLCDLMSPYNSLKRIWSSDKEKRFDRISFFENIISLWEDDKSSSNALKIELPHDWTDTSERYLLLQQACKNWILFKTLAALK